MRDWWSRTRRSRESLELIVATAMALFILAVFGAWIVKQWVDPSPCDAICQQDRRTINIDDFTH